MPVLGMPLQKQAKDLEAKIRSQLPPDMRSSVVVKVLKNKDMTGISINYDDKVESLVYVALEYPRDGKRTECAAPRTRSR